MIKDTLTDFLLAENCSKSELARRIGLPHGQFTKYFLGVPPEFESAIKIANYFHCSLDYLFGLTDKFTKTKCLLVLDRYSFIEKYLKLLEKNKVSHFAVCKEIGISEKNLSYWKKHNLPTTQVVIKIADYFGVSIDCLVCKIDK